MATFKKLDGGKMSENQNVSVRNKQSEMAAEAAKMYNIAYDLVNKTYLNKIESMKIVPLTDSGIENRDSINFRLVEITRIVHDEKKSALDNLLNVLATMHPDYTVALIIKSNRGKTHFYMGIRSSTQSKPASSGIKLLEQAIEGNFPGSDHRSFNGNEINSILDTSDLRKETQTWAIGSTSFIPSLKHDDTGQFTQGLERFIDAMYGKDYTAMILAEPVNHEQLVSLQTGYESMATTLSLYQKTQISMSINESQAISESVTKGVTETLSNSVTLSQSFTQGSSISKSDTEGTSTNRAGTGASAGALIGGAIGLLGGPLGVAIGAAIGGGLGGAVGGLMGEKNRSHTESLSSNESNTAGENIQTGNSKAESVSDTKGSTQTSGESESISLEQHNKGIERMLSKIEQQLKRIDASRSYGIWNASFYVLSDNTESAHTACSLFKGMLKGNESAVEDSAITVWNQKQDNTRQNALDYFENIVHPRLVMGDTDDVNKVNVTPSSLVSGKELSLLMNFPRKSVCGLTVIDGISFGREPRVLDVSGIPSEDRSKDCLTLGVVRNLFKDYTHKVKITLDNMVYHTLVTGTTGAGKTNTIKVLINSIAKKIPFLVIEPAKNEYKELVYLSNSITSIRYYQAGKGTKNDSSDNCLRMNPLVFPQNADITINEHIDRICALFNAAFPMYAAMPQVLEEAIIQAYEKCGWDLATSSNINVSPEYPTLLDVAELIPMIVEDAGYEYESKSTYIGALTTRLQSLCRGSLGYTFLVNINQETSAAELFDESCVINLSSIGSSEKKSILMGLLLIRLYEHRITQTQTEVDKLKHLMVLEEAHHLLKRVSKDQSQEGSNPQGQAVEYLGNMLAEMRAFGQAMLIVDQSPSALDDSVQRNTNIKIAFRAPFEDDRKIIGGALNLDDKQMRSLASLENHTALVKQNDWLEPILCHFDKFIKPTDCRHPDSSLQVDKNRNATTVLLYMLLGNRFPENCVLPDLRIDKEELKNWLNDRVLEPAKRELLIDYIENPVNDYELVRMIPILFAIPSLEGIIYDALTYLQASTSIINNIQAKIKLLTLFKDPPVLKEIAHTLLVAYRTEKAEFVDDRLLEDAQVEED
jgi:hypothetical protein